jgi:hypothetical protein
MDALRRGDYAEALGILEECLKQHGSHVGLLSDLALAAYLKEDMGRFTLAVEQLEREAAAADATLSPESRIRTRVALAKCFELQGRIAEAFDEIEAALALLPAGHELTIPVRCQKLRLLASFGRENEVASLYAQCAGVSEESKEAKIESFHALLIAEARLLGLEHAWPRLQHLAGESALHAADLRLCAFDLLEIAIETRDRAAQERIIGFATSLEAGQFDAYEETLLWMGKNSGERLGANRIFEWGRRMPSSAIIRLLALELFRMPGEASREIRKQLVFRLQSVDHRTRRLLTRKWAEVLHESAGMTLELDVAAKAVRLPNGTISLAKSPQSWAVLQELRGRQVVPTAELLDRLAKAGGAQDYDSLRVQIVRMNRKLVASLQVEWVVRFGKEKVQLNPRIRFQDA